MRGKVIHTNKERVEQLVRDCASCSTAIEVRDLERKLKAAQARLKQLQNSCSHAWSESIDTSIVTEGYTDPGDVPGTMGIDFRGPSYIPGSTKKQWTRVCSLCGATETTDRVSKAVTERPQF